MPIEVIMPALGMAQDSGRIVAWRKRPGEAVCAGDILFEVETDKATMEVEASDDGFLREVRAEVGQDVPVGEVIAVIVPDKPAAADSPGNADIAPSPSGRVLASPKARRLALQKSIDLGALVAAGCRQPLHARDVATAEPLPESSAAPLIQRLQVAIDKDGFSSFADWAAVEAGLDDATALLAGLAAGGFSGAAITVRVDSGGKRALFAVGERRLSSVRPLSGNASAPPDLIVRDFRSGAPADAAPDSGNPPVLSLLTCEGGLSAALEYDRRRMPPEEADACLSNFVACIRQPLCRLL